MTTPSMNDQQLLDYSYEHLMHEITMFWETADLLPKGRKGSTEYVALLESFALHLRNLIEFLTFGPKDEYVRAHQFFEDPDDWRPDRPPELTTLHGRASNEVAHLTTRRVSGSPPEKDWHTDQILQQIEPILSKFATEASRKKLHPGVREFLNVPSGERLVWIGNHVMHANVAAQQLTTLSATAASTATIIVGPPLDITHDE